MTFSGQSGTYRVEVTSRHHSNITMEIVAKFDGQTLRWTEPTLNARDWELIDEELWKVTPIERTGP